MKKYLAVLAVLAVLGGCTGNSDTTIGKKEQGSTNVTSKGTKTFSVSKEVNLGNGLQSLNKLTKDGSILGTRDPNSELTSYYYIEKVDMEGNKVFSKRIWDWETDELRDFNELKDGTIILTAGVTEDDDEEVQDLKDLKEVFYLINPKKQEKDYPFAEYEIVDSPFVSDYTYNLEVSENGDIYVLGEYKEQDKNSTDYRTTHYLAKLDKNLKIEWKTDLNAYVGHILVTRDNHIIVYTDSRLIKYDSKGKELWNKDYASEMKLFDTRHKYITPYEELEDGSLIAISSYSRQESKDEPDLVTSDEPGIMKIKPDGTVEWEKDLFEIPYGVSNSVQNISSTKNGLLITGLESKDKDSRNESDPLDFSGMTYIAHVSKDGELLSKEEFKENFHYADIYPTKNGNLVLFANKLHPDFIYDSMFYELIKK